MSPSKQQADLLKQEGNAFFKKDRISAAIDAYTGVRVALRSASRTRRGHNLFCTDIGGMCS
jgi:hypothetical protein